MTALCIGTDEPRSATRYVTSATFARTTTSADAHLHTSLAVAIPSGQTRTEVARCLDKTGSSRWRGQPDFSACTKDHHGVKDHLRRVWVRVFTYASHVCRRSFTCEQPVVAERWLRRDEAPDNELKGRNVQRSAGRYAAWSASRVVCRLRQRRNRARWWWLVTPGGPGMRAASTVVAHDGHCLFPYR